MEETKLLKKKLSEKEAQLDKIEKKFLLDEIDKVMYQKHATTIKEEIEILTNDLSKTDIHSSNLEKFVEKCLEIAQNISGAWVSSGLRIRGYYRISYFPREYYTAVRTERINSLFGAIPSLVKVLTEKKKGNLDEDYLNSNFVTFGSRSSNLLLEDLLKISCYC